MNRIIFYFSCFLFYCAINNSYAQQVSFYKKYTASNELLFNSICLVHDGNYIIAGQQHGPNGGDYFLLKTDSNGNELWRKKNNLFDADYNSSNIIYCIRETKDSGFIMCGMITLVSDGFPNRQFYIAKSDSIGNKLWEKIYGTSSSEEFRQLLIVNDGNFFFLGRKSIAPQSDIILMKTNSIGDSLWTKTYSFSPFNARAEFIINTGPSYFIAGTLTDPVNYNRKGVFLKIDSCGNILYSSIIKDTISVLILNAKIDFKKSIFLITSNTSSFGGYSTIINLDSSLTEINRIVFPHQYFVTFLSDSEFFGVSPNIHTIKGTITGSVTWQLSTPEEFAFPNDLICNYPNSILSVGKIDEDQSTTAIGYILKIKDTTSIFANKYFFSSSSIVKIVPNPFTNEASLIIDDELIKKYGTLDLEIFDSFGNSVMNYYRISQSETAIEKKSLKSGSYIYQINKNKIKIISNKFIIN